MSGIDYSLISRIAGKAWLQGVRSEKVDLYVVPQNMDKPLRECKVFLMFTPMKIKFIRDTTYTYHGFDFDNEVTTTIPYRSLFHT